MEQITEFLNRIENEGQISVSTRKAYASDLHRFSEYLANNQKPRQPFQQITTKNLLRFLDHEKKIGLKPSTLHRRRVSLKKFAEFLASRGDLDEKSAQEVGEWQQNLWEEIASREAISLTEDEVDRLFAVIDADEKPRNLRDKAIIALILNTGMSIGSLVRLNLMDIDLEKNRVRIDANINRWTKISKASGLLGSYLEISRPELTQISEEEALFVSQMGGRITRQGVWQVIKSWGVAAGLDISLSPRVLRHTAARRMINEQKPKKEIQQMLGHHNEHSTQALIRKIIKSMERGGINGHERIYHD